MNNLARLERKMDTARRELPAPIVDGSGSEVGIIGYGSTTTPWWSPAISSSARRI